MLGARRGTWPVPSHRSCFQSFEPVRVVILARAGRWPSYTRRHVDWAWKWLCCLPSPSPNAREGTEENARPWRFFEVRFRIILNAVSKLHSVRRQYNRPHRSRSPRRLPRCGHVYTDHPRAWTRGKHGAVHGAKAARLRALLQCVGETWGPGGDCVSAWLFG